MHTSAVPPTAFEDMSDKRLQAGLSTDPGLCNNPALAARRIHWQYAGSSATSSAIGRPLCLPPGLIDLMRTSILGQAICRCMPEALIASERLIRRPALKLRTLVLFHFLIA